MAYHCKIRYCRDEIIPIEHFENLSEEDRKQFYRGWTHYAEDEKGGYISKECIYQNDNGKDCKCKYPQPDEYSLQEHQRVNDPENIERGMQNGS